MALFQFPDSKFCNNNKSAICHSECVSSGIEELLKTGIILQVNDVPHVVNPLTVSVNAKSKERLILDLRHVNQYVILYKFKLEGIKEALDFAQKDGFMCKFDLFSWYHHTDLHPSIFKYFEFSWSGEFYVFTSLPYSFSSAPFMFTKIL